jgi:serine/threonine protein kinase
MTKKQQVKAIREIKIMQGVGGHPNIVQYLSSFISDENIYIVLEYCQGGDISNLIYFLKGSGRYLYEQQG